MERLLFQDQKIDPSLISNILVVPDFKQDSTKIFNLSQSAVYKPSPPKLDTQPLLLDPGYYVSVPTIKKEEHEMFSVLEEAIRQECCSKDQVCEGTQQTRVQVNLELPGSTTETLWMSSLATLQEMRNQVSDKFLAGEEDFHLMYDGLVLSSDLSCSLFDGTTIRVVCSVQGGGQSSASASPRRKRGRKSSARRAARYRQTKLTYDKTCDLMLLRERPQEDPDFKEVEEMVEDQQVGNEHKAARDAVKQHKSDHKTQKVKLHGTLHLSLTC